MKQRKHRQISEKQYKKDVRKYEFIRFLAGGILTKFFHYEYKFNKLDENGPYLIMANHAVELDPVLLGIAFPHMYFVASEHIFSWGFWSKLIVNILHPIARKKGSVDALTVLEIRRRLALGANVGIFPEGNRTMSGETERIHPTTVKLIRSCKCGLVTFKIKGGFMFNPRFSRKFRKGPITGETVNMYSKEDIEAMTDEELYERLCEDLYENAFDTQRERNYRYISKAPARGLEAGLYWCPVCNSFGTLHSTDTEIVCTCGMRASYDEYGRLGGVDIPSYDKWYHAQREALAALPDKVLEDREGVRAYIGTDDHKRVALDVNGFGMDGKRLYLTKDGVTVRESPLSEIPSVTYFGVNNLVFYIGRDYHIVTGDLYFNARKYIDKFEFVKENEE